MPNAHDERQRQYVVRRAYRIVMQGGRCPCGDDLLGEVHIDHDHSCCDVDRADRACGNCDRAAVHPGCNSAISRVKENPQRLRALADYLDRVAA